MRPTFGWTTIILVSLRAFLFLAVLTTWLLRVPSEARWRACLAAATVSACSHFHSGRATRVWIASFWSVFLLSPAHDAAVTSASASASASAVASAVASVAAGARDLLRTTLFVLVTWSLASASDLFLWNWRKGHTAPLLPKRRSDVVQVGRAVVGLSVTVRFTLVLEYSYSQTGFKVVVVIVRLSVLSRFSLLCGRAL